MDKVDKIEKVVTKYVIKVSVINVLSQLGIGDRLKVLDEIKDIYTSELAIFGEVK